MRRIRKMLGCFLALILVLGMMPVSAMAAGTDIQTVRVEVTYGQTEARTMLAMMNEFRTGSDAWAWNESNTEKVSYSDLGELTYDYKLEAIAMQRAAEIALSFSHDRPNGKDCLTAYGENSYQAKGENIACGSSSAADVFKLWQETDKKYEGQGHRRNMLSKNFAAVGIGHVYYNGTHYWVQEFGNPASGAARTNANDAATSVSVDIRMSDTVVSIIGKPDSLTVDNGKSVEVPALTVTVKMAAAVPGTECKVSVDYTWQVADETYASVSNGRITGIKEGTTTLNTTILGQSISIPLTVKECSHEYEETVTREATCTDMGEKTYTCKICGSTYTEETAALGHTYDEGKTTKEAACTEAGERVYTCTVCQDTYTEEIAAKGHAFDEGKVTKESNCIAAGERIYTCTVCGETYTEEIPATGEHSYDIGTETKKATCAEPGIKTYTCTICGETYTEEIPATGEHVYDKGTVTKESTCTETGVKTYTCTVCRETKTEEIPTEEHTYDKGVVTKEATCAEAGVKTYTCTKCGEIRTEEIPATGKHIYDKGTVTKEATCTEDGVKTYTCTVCNESYTEKIPAAGHTYDKGVITKEATCTEAGVKTYTCTVCKTTKTEEIPAAGHTYDKGAITTKATCTKAGVKTYTCTVCKTTKTEEIPAAGHSYGKPVFTWKNNSSCTAVFTCKACGDKQTVKCTVTSSKVSSKEVKYTAKAEFGGKSYTDAKTVKTLTAASPETGDATNIIFWVVLLALSVVGIAASVVRRRKS